MAERQDRRTRRTRAALIEAFNHLVLRRRGPIRVAEIVEHANVGRSTFYDHYRSAEDLHMEALARPFAILADAAAGEAEESRLAWILAHFWENRARARETLVGSSRERATRLLAGLIEERLPEPTPHPPIPARLASLQLAEAMLAPIRAWVAGEAPCTAAALAAALVETGRRMRPPIRHGPEAAEHGTALGADLQTPRCPITSGRAGPGPSDG